MTRIDTQERMFPLTLAQLDFWEEFRHHPDEAVSTVAHIIEISGGVDCAALTRAIRATIAETDVLSIRFQTADPALPLQACDPDRLPDLHEIDLRDRPDPMAAARKMMTQDLHHPLDLARDPISAQWLIRVGQDHWLWYNRGHHIILDGYSMGLIEERCAELYAHFTLGDPAGTPLLRFSAYLAEEDSYRQSPRHDAARQFWSDRVAEAGTLPVIRKGEENYAVEAHGFDFSLPDSDALIAALAQETRLGWADLITILTSAYLLRHLPEARGKDAALPVWLPFMSRMGSVSARVPALVVNILPLAISATDQTLLADFLTQTARSLRQLRRHGRYRIEQIAQDCGVPFGSRFFFSPLVNVMPFDRPQFKGCKAVRHILSNGPADGFNVTIRAEHDGSGMILRIDADPALTPQDQFDAHCRALPAFLATALKTDSLPLPLSALSPPT